MERVLLCNTNMVAPWRVVFQNPGLPQNRGNNFGMGPISDVRDPLMTSKSLKIYIPIRYGCTPNGPSSFSMGFTEPIFSSLFIYTLYCGL